jgi:molybdopterin synthase sulfur carrier subunit
MSIQIKFFASLREQLGKECSEIAASDASNIRQCWQAATACAELPANTLCAINMNYARLDDAVHDGDEVAFFPPVTGG